MLKSHPESNLATNVLVLGSEVIEMLKNKKSFVIVEKIMQDFLRKDRNRTPELFMDALTFLFIIGLVEYKGYRVKLKRHGTTQTSLL
jgi:hypothetical protein